MRARTATALRARLAKTTFGDPAVEGVRMGALASHAQLADVADRVARLSADGQVDATFGVDGRASVLGAGSIFAEGMVLQRQLLTSGGIDADALVDTRRRGVEYSMDSDKPGMLIRKQLLELLARHGEAEVHRGVAARPVLHDVRSRLRGRGW